MLQQALATTRSKESKHSLRQQGAYSLNTVLWFQIHASNEQLKRAFKGVKASIKRHFSFSRYQADVSRRTVDLVRQPLAIIPHLLSLNWLYRWIRTTQKCYQRHSTLLLRGITVVGAAAGCDG